ncbi:uncharacterized protein MYCGRDRAFT_110884 [Zymoseptoria tritici IPO323]|uniref:Uncharacterized protein n=1 Tax=Zymoseptoria tritici (strain CBS 115943 / IPO323) TaxID=336722 RepID=F9XKE0_ZYMTI|nr:uncharacterized protein MYCGRDRAFT_110884 [Zymoseptoria tritici IPO323]EGP84555.1 hypothetical protein MYCGRDRAFT_110884 [Zymoseptoria tritici IPO323]
MPFIHGIDGQLLQAGLAQRAITTTYELHPGVSAPPPLHALTLPYPAEEALRLTDNALGQARWIHQPYFISIASPEASLDLLHPAARSSTSSPYIDDRGERVVLCETRPGMPDRVAPRLGRRRVRREQPTVSMKDLVVPHSPPRTRTGRAKELPHNETAEVTRTGSHEANDRGTMMARRRRDPDILRKDSIHSKNEGGETATDDMDIDLATDPAPTSSHSGTLQGPSKRLKTTTSPKHP